MFDSGSTLRIIFVLFLLKCVLKGLRTCVESVGNICGQASDLWTSRQVDTTRPKVCLTARV